MNRKSEILFVTPRIPAPGVFGDQLRAWNFLKQVAESFEVTLVCLDSGGNEEDRQRLRDGLVKEAVFIPHARPLAAIGAVAGLLRGQPAQVGWFSNRTLEKQLAELAATGRFEAAFVQLARMAGAVKALGPVPVVMDFVDALSLQWLRRAERGKGPLSWFNAVEGARMTEVEREMLRLCFSSFATGPDDAQHMEAAMSDGTKVDVIPNGVDLGRFKPLLWQEPNPEPVLLFSGNLDYQPNRRAVLFFAEKVLPLVRETHPQARFVAAGRVTGSELKEAAGRLDFELTGFVDDLAAEIAAADVVVAPMQNGAGIQNKVLEAMACGVPVVATHMANAAIEAAHGREIMIGASPEALAARVTTLLDDPEGRRRMGERGRNLVKRKFSWEAQGDVVAGHLEDAARAAAGFRVPVREGGEWGFRTGLEWLRRGEEAFFSFLVQALHAGVSLVILLLFLPLLAILAPLIKLTSPGPVFYSQVRLGVDRRAAAGKRAPAQERRGRDLGGKTFTIWKLRTMRADAEAATGPVWAGQDDPRITRVGRWLRRTRLDEVPQLWNVLKGDMALVGPRPERPYFAEELRRTYPGYADRLRNLKPGLTGLAQVWGEYDTTIEKVNDKLILDYGYRVNSLTARDRFLADGRILLATIPTVLTGKGAR